MSAGQWIERTAAVGILVKAGRYGGTYAHRDIAFHFAMWLSPEFQIYLVKEFQRLQETEQKQLGWDVKRNLTKINYRIHTDAIRAHLIPPELSRKQVSLIYASEADVLNMALFGRTAKDWRDANPNEKGNIRDQANASQLVCLANLENLTPSSSTKACHNRSACKNSTVLRLSKWKFSPVNTAADFWGKERRNELSSGSTR